MGRGRIELGGGRSEWVRGGSGGYKKGMEEGQEGRGERMGEGRVEIRREGWGRIGDGRVGKRVNQVGKGVSQVGNRKGWGSRVGSFLPSLVPPPP